MSAPDLRSHAITTISLASMGASTDVISDRAELETFARRNLVNFGCVFSMR